MQHILCLLLSFIFINKMSGALSHDFMWRFMSEGSINIYTRAFGNIPIKSKNAWVRDRELEQLGSIDSSTLEKELEADRANLENLTAEFENSFRNSDANSTDPTSQTENELLAMMHNSSKLEDSLKKYPFTIGNGESISCIIPHCMDIIQTLSIEIELDNEFDDLTLEQKHALLNSKFKFSIGGQDYENFNLLTGILIQSCKSRNIKYDGKTIQIPICDFTTWYNKLTGVNGLYFLRVQYHEAVVKLSLPSNLFNKLPKLVISGFIADSHNRRKEAQNGITEHITFENNRSQLIPASSDSSKLNIFGPKSKVLIIHFMEKNNPPRETSGPRLTSLSLYLEGEMLIADYDESDILSVDIFGIVVYLIPLCEELSTWELLKKTFENPTKNMGLNGISSKSGKTIKWACDEITNINISDYLMSVSSISPNIIRICSGQAAPAYSF